MESAINILSKTVTALTKILAYLFSLALIVQILWKDAANNKGMIASGLDSFVTTLHDHGFSGFVAFILFVCIFSYIHNKE